MASKYGKDRPAKGSEGFISGALTGGSGKSNGIHDYPVDRPNQQLKTAFPMDNVKLAMPMDSSIEDVSFPGGSDDISHSLTGASAVDSDLGNVAKGKKTIIPDH